MEMKTSVILCPGENIGLDAWREGSREITTQIAHLEKVLQVLHCDLNSHYSKLFFLNLDASGIQERKWKIIWRVQVSERMELELDNVAIAGVLDFYVSSHRNQQKTKQK